MAALESRLGLEPQGPREPLPRKSGAGSSKARRAPAGLGGEKQQSHLGGGERRKAAAASYRKLSEQLERRGPPKR